MSVIHEAVKASEKSVPPVSAKTPSAPSAPSWLWWLTLGLVLAQGALYAGERMKRREAEEKTKKALLLMNDERGKTLDLLKDKADFRQRAEAVEEERDRVLKEKASLAEAKQKVELENVEKEKQLSQMSKDLHALKMSRSELENEVRLLQERVALLSAPAEQPADTPK